MRMRMKKNLETRMEKCESVLLDTPVFDKDSRLPVTGEQYIDLPAVFGRKAPLRMDIGCGKGQFTRELAKQNPDIDIISVEIVRNVIVAACEKVVRDELTNVRFMCLSAEYLPRFIPEHSVELIYLNFSCPYKNCKLTAPRFLECYRRMLTENGEIHLKTDNMGFFEYSIEQLSQAGYKLKNISLDLHNSGFEGNIVTEYEKKFSDLGQPIYRLEASVQ